MGFVNQTANIKVNNRNRSRLIELGYDVPKTSTRSIWFEVNIFDISKTSTQKVDFECDNCHKQYKLSISDYWRRNRDGKMYCNKCAHTLFNSGENNNRWNPNLTDEERQVKRNYPEYIDFCRKVKIRDNFTCRCCGTQHNIEVHHLNGYMWDIDGRVNVENGVVLCKDCHLNFHNKYGKYNNTKEQFEKWLGKTVKYLEFKDELPPARQVICLETKQIYDSPKDVANNLNVVISLIHKCCLRQESRFRYGTSTKSVKGYHFLYLDDYNTMSKDEWDKYIKWINESKSFVAKNGRHSSCRSVICLTTNEIFESMIDAVRKYNFSSGSLTDCCKGRKNFCGKLEDGTKLHWMYYEDYLNNKD